jgi:hypothetical protein
MVISRLMKGRNDIRHQSYRREQTLKKIVSFVFALLWFPSSAFRCEPPNFDLKTKKLYFLKVFEKHVQETNILFLNQTQNYLKTLLSSIKY